MLAQRYQGTARTATGPRATRRAAGPGARGDQQLPRRAQLCQAAGHLALQRHEQAVPGGSPPTRTLFTVLRRVALGPLFTLGREWRVPARGDLLRDRGRRAAGHPGTCSSVRARCAHALVHTRAHPACLCSLRSVAAASLRKLGDSARHSVPGFFRLVDSWVFPPSCRGSKVNSVPIKCFAGIERPGLVLAPYVSPSSASGPQQLQVPACQGEVIGAADLCVRVELPLRSRAGGKNSISLKL